MLTWPNGNTDTTTVTYDREGENTLVGGGTTLVTAVGYNDMGQLKRLALNNGLTTWYGYLGYSASGNNDAYDATWGQFGKLWRICTAPHASNRCTYTDRNTTPLEQRLDLRYAYDDVGNLTTILDKMNSDQTQSFGYDHLNRLTSAGTNSAGSGQYTHTYAYNTLGNITSYNGATYTYTSAHKHAVYTAQGVTPCCGEVFRVWCGRCSTPRHVCLPVISLFANGRLLFVRHHFLAYIPGTAADGEADKRMGAAAKEWIWQHGRQQ